VFPSISDAWGATLGAVPGDRGTSFRVWAPSSAAVELVLEPDGGRRPLARHAPGMFYGAYADVGPGVRYRYSLDGDGPFPDPASRWQPDGVHGASVVVDPRRFAWSDRLDRSSALELVIYELHVGTFSPAGTFAGATALLPHLRDLGVSAVELMPVADFPGARNWGYDGASLFAPAHTYGTPDDLRRFVDAAHGLGLAVLMDVVYNHTGPDGCYLGRFSPYYFTDRHVSPWGAGIDLDGEHAAPVRRFFIENALHWIHEYHMDGIRLDATHAMQDDGPRHFLAELAECVHQAASGRRLHVIAEDHRNLAAMIAPPDQGGWGLDAVWADDFHHQMRRLLAGDREGYYRDFAGTTADIATTVRQGWFFTGQYSEHLQEPRGTDPAGVPAERFVVCLQNHDQVGNRALGDRLHPGSMAPPIEPRRAAAHLPHALLFMGGEWAASAPSATHRPRAGPRPSRHGRAGVQGLRGVRRCAARDTFRSQASTRFSARLDWAERTRAHASTLALYRAALTFRRTCWPLRRRHVTSAPPTTTPSSGQDVRRATHSSSAAAAAANPPRHSIGDRPHTRLGGRLHGADWSDREARPAVETRRNLLIHFTGPAAVILTEVDAPGPLVPMNRRSLS
jgi:maltooligosyltrehalose trehalohydrolase